MTDLKAKVITKNEEKQKLIVSGQYCDNKTGTLGGSY